MKKINFGDCISPQTLNINTYGTTSAKLIDLDIITKFTKYSSQVVLVKARFTITVFEILLFEGRSVLSPV